MSGRASKSLLDNCITAGVWISGLKVVKVAVVCCAELTFEIR